MIEEYNKIDSDYCDVPARHTCSRKDQFGQSRTVLAKFLKDGRQDCPYGSDEQ